MKKERGRERGEEEVVFGLTIKQTVFALYINFIIHKYGIFKGAIKEKSSEGVEKREPSYTVGGNVNWYDHYGE